MVEFWRAYPRAAPSRCACLDLDGSRAGDLARGIRGPAGCGDELDLVEDNHSGSLDLAAIFPEGFDCFSGDYSAIFVNENGNLSFGQGYSAFAPLELPLNGRPPVIAPFWSDVDLCRPVFAVCAEPPFIDNSVYWHHDVDGGRCIATWHEVRYELAEKDKASSFQIVLTARPDVLPQAFDTEFRYAQLEWTASEGVSVDDGGGQRAGLFALSRLVLALHPCRRRHGTRAA